MTDTARPLNDLSSFIDAQYICPHLSCICLHHLCVLVYCPSINGKVRNSFLWVGVCWKVHKRVRLSFFMGANGKIFHPPSNHISCNAHTTSNLNGKNTNLTPQNWPLYMPHHWLTCVTGEASLPIYINHCSTQLREFLEIYSVCSLVWARLKEHIYGSIVIPPKYLKLS